MDDFTSWHSISYGYSIYNIEAVFIKHDKKGGTTFTAPRIWRRGAVDHRCSLQPPYLCGQFDLMCTVVPVLFKMYYLNCNTLCSQRRTFDGSVPTHYRKFCTQKYLRDEQVRNAQYDDWWLLLKVVKKFQTAQWYNSKLYSDVLPKCWQSVLC